MNKIYFGFAVADSMFEGDVTISRKTITANKVKEILSSAACEVIPCLNPSHAATIAAMQSRFEIEIPIPEEAPKVELSGGDTLIVMSVRGLPRLDATRHEYTEDEVARATFVFSVYCVE